MEEDIISGLDCPFNRSHLGHFVSIYFVLRHLRFVRILHKRRLLVFDIYHELLIIWRSKHCHCIIVSVHKTLKSWFMSIFYWGPLGSFTWLAIWAMLRIFTLHWLCVDNIDCFIFNCLECSLVPHFLDPY